ncbi:MAG: hypothetical protein ABR974_00545 [Bacteroidales bacterium]|jgi:hypothetical protein
MKKSTFSLGLISSSLFFVSVFMKFLHWPGAYTLMVAAAAIFVLGYSTMLYLDKNKLATTSFQKTVNVISMLAMMIVMVCFIFKAMHWCGANIAIYVGHLCLLILIPVLFIQGSEETDTVRKLNAFNSAIMLVFLTGFSFFIWLVMGAR